MTKKNEIEKQMEHYTKSVRERVESQIKQAFLAGVRCGLELTSTHDVEVPDAED